MFLSYILCLCWAGVGGPDTSVSVICYNTVISSRVCYKCRDPSHQTVTVVVMKSIVEELKLRA